MGLLKIKTENSSMFAVIAYFDCQINVPRMFRIKMRNISYGLIPKMIKKSLENSELRRLDGLPGRFWNSKFNAKHDAHIYFVQKLRKIP